MLKPNFWKDVVPQDFVNDVKRYIDSEAELVKAHAGYSKSNEKRFRDCSNTGKIKIWNFLRLNYYHGRSASGYI